MTAIRRGRAPRYRRRLATVLVASGLLALACSSEDVDDSDDDDTTETAASPGTGATDTATDGTATDESPADTAGGDTTTAGTEGGDAGEPVSGGDLTYIWNTEPRTMDPTVASMGKSSDGPYTFAVYDMLVRVNKDTFEASPGLAKSLESDDGTNWTMTLQEGVTFHDGTPFNAEAVKFNWDRYIAEAPVQSAASLAIASTEVVDELTLAITLNRVFPEFPLSLERLQMVASPTAVQAGGDQYGESPVGAGPFVFEEWVRGSGMSFSKNPNYWEEGKPYIDSLRINVMPDPNARLNALLAGEADVGAPRPADASNLEDIGMKEVENPLTGAFGTSGWVFNSQKPPFDTVEARCAVQQAIDFVQMGEDLGAGRVFIPTGFFHTGPNSELDVALHPEFDREAAQEVFSEVAAANGGTFSFTLDGLTLSQTEAEYYQSQFATYDDVDVQIGLHEVSDLITMVNTGEHQMAQLGLGDGSTPPASVLSLNLHTREGQPYAYVGFGNPELDAILDTAPTSLDDEARNEAVIAAGQILTDECLFRATPRVSLGPPYAVEELQGWYNNTGSVQWQDVWFSA